MYFQKVYIRKENMNVLTLMAGVLTLIVDSKAGSQDTYVAFVVDDTGSMSKEIGAVKKWMKHCVGGIRDACGNTPTGGWIVTTFNDPTVGPVFGPSTDQSRVQSTISAINAHGGGDAPELALTGLKNALNVIPNTNGGCKIYTFTDAVAKDEHLRPEALNLLFAKKCQFYPILSGCDDLTGSRECVKCLKEEFPKLCDAISDGRSSSGRKKRQAPASKPGEAIYYELAQKSGGRVFLVDKPKTDDELVDFLEETIVLGFCPTNQIAGPPSIGYADKRDCNRQDSCWDKAARKCYCKSLKKCPTNSICPETTLALSYPYPGRGNCAKYYSFSDGFKILTCPKGKVYDVRCQNCNHLNYVSSCM